MAASESESSPPPKRLLAQGGIRKRTDGRVLDQPVLYWFPGSFNSGKATLAMQLSQKKNDHRSRLVLHMRNNYEPDYVRLNPDTCAVPTLEIDDQVCTDSLEICRYLLEHYPGPGDAALSTEEKHAMMEWVHCCNAWDEYQYTYGHQPTKDALMANEIRLYHLRTNLEKICKEKPQDKDFLVQAYIRKIAGVTTMHRAMKDGKGKEDDMANNLAQLHSILQKANQLAQQHPNGYLFGERLTTGDVYFLPVLRIFRMVPPPGIQLNDQDLWKRYPHLKGYWERACLDKDVRVGLLDCIKIPNLVWTMLSQGVPRLMLSYKLGWMSPPPKLAEDIEERIAVVCEESWEEARGQERGDQ